MPEDISHPVFARIYPRIERFALTHGAAAHREELLDGAGGRILEIGVGTGANIPFYPPAVESLVAVEPEPRLRARAQRASEEAPFPVEVVPGRAEQLPFPDDAFDTVIVSLVLCSVRDVDRAVTEIRRVLRPDGHLRFYEHIRSDRPRFARMQRSLDLIWPRLGGNCHLSRDPESALVRNGLAVETVRHFDFAINGRLNPSSPCAIGRASAE
ncbi:class I SAM-dependent methyltransferase [Streptomyces sp. WMMB 322]|uniref:class I SAM-dependent methyltransferase n=1 Tax=Streptomyces sp. WMMB 322 TaxID=1286821 RepID=UPI0006E3B19F|nr:class I SAM-dependent methyltransferase [Streptomyces sp. WMMB 322]SCK15459.1 Ubiquinone/menaquinone biosynthesis C-methylase UbiE [Streptomyces sp. WMMB 322]